VVECAPTAFVRLDAKLFADSCGDKEGRRAGIDNEVVRSLAINLGPDHHMLRVGDLKGDAIGFRLDFRTFVGVPRRDKAGEPANEHVPRSWHAVTPRWVAAWPDQGWRSVPPCIIPPR